MKAAPVTVAQGVDALAAIDWSFRADGQPHPLHGIHPYPAKFVPALPRHVIEALSDPGDLVVDPFCGSGTALLEALLLGRRAVGGDLNPVAVVAACAKTQLLTTSDLERLEEVRETIDTRVSKLLAADIELPPPREWEPTAGRRFKGLKFWFSPQVAQELSALKLACATEGGSAPRAVLDMCLSAIVVSVSRQDSDTRYVRREKTLAEGIVPELFGRRLAVATAALSDLRENADSSATVSRCDSRRVDYVEAGTAQLVVTSPPYPNAWSYHLYHQNRILWLDQDPWDFKANEIGHHRAYSAKDGAGEVQFRADMTESLACMHHALRPGGYAVVVVGDSIVRGERIRNDDVVVGAAEESGFRHCASFDRVIDPKRKAFNPSIGKIKVEHVLVFER